MAPYIHRLGEAIWAIVVALESIIVVSVVLYSISVASVTIVAPTLANALRTEFQHHGFNL